MWLLLPLASFAPSTRLRGLERFGGSPREESPRSRAQGTWLETWRGFGRAEATSPVAVSRRAPPSPGPNAIIARLCSPLGRLVVVSLQRLARAGGARGGGLREAGMEKQGPLSLPHLGCLGWPPCRRGGGGP